MRTPTPPLPHNGGGSEQHVAGWCAAGVPWNAAQNRIPCVRCDLNPHFPPLQPTYLYRGHARVQQRRKERGGAVVRHHQHVHFLPCQLHQRAVHVLAAAQLSKAKHVIGPLRLLPCSVVALSMEKRLRYYKPYILGGDGEDASDTGNGTRTPTAGRHLLANRQASLALAPRSKPTAHFTGKCPSPHPAVLALTHAHTRASFGNNARHTREGTKGTHAPPLQPHRCPQAAPGQARRGASPGSAAGRWTVSALADRPGSPRVPSPPVTGRRVRATASAPAAPAAGPTTRRGTRVPRREPQS